MRLSSGEATSKRVLSGEKGNVEVSAKVKDALQTVAKEKCYGCQGTQGAYRARRDYAVLTEVEFLIDLFCLPLLGGVGRSSVSFVSREPSFTPRDYLPDTVNTSKLAAFWRPRAVLRAEKFDLRGVS